MIQKFVRVGSHKIRYIEAGSNSKKVLVLVHGLGASAERWEHVIPELSKKYTVIAPDLPGFGYSDKPSLDYTPQFFAEFLSDFLETIGKNNTPIRYQFVPVTRNVTGCDLLDIF
jgi:2-hydroxy-6-oxonona-2,4-dienedioate hydrolase